MERPTHTAITARFVVRSDDGQEFTITEHTTFVQISPLSEPPTTLPGQRALRNGRHPVNAREDGDFDVFTGGMEPIRCRRA